MTEKKLECNADLVLDLMNFSKFGAMGQVFIMEAIRGYSQMVIDGKVGNPHPAWPAIAVDVRDRCTAFYERHDEGVA